VSQVIVNVVEAPAARIGTGAVPTGAPLAVAVAVVLIGVADTPVLETVTDIEIGVPTRPEVGEGVTAVTTKSKEGGGEVTVRRNVPELPLWPISLP